MRRSSTRAVIFSVICLAVSGCVTQPDARYVYQDGDYGVIGIPLNTTYGKKKYLEQAESLMTRHFPKGYEIVRAEEVVDGERTIDIGKVTQIETDPTFSALNQMVRLGRLAQSKSREQKDKIPILESRIIYKRKLPGKPAGANGFTLLASEIPKFYIDPNEAARCHNQELIAEEKAGAGKSKPGDPDIKKAAHSAPAADATATSTTATPK